MRKVAAKAGMLIALIMLFYLVLPVLATVIRPCTDATRHSPAAHGSAHHPVVQQLVDLVNADPAFHAEMLAALVEQEPSSYWHGKTLDDMYIFLDEWVVFLPTIDTARLYMDRFYEFAGSGLGQQLASRDPLRGWLYQFMLAVEDFKDSPASASIVPSWTSDPRINMADFVVPPGGFQSFNDFFLRRIKPGVRPIDAPDNPAILTSPADSSLMNIANRLTSVTTIGVKGENLNIRELLGNDPLADNFINGRAVLCMLDTTDYHHFHAPVPGRIVAQEQLGGLYYGMDGGWVEYFFQHRRGYIIFDTAKFGHVAMVCVGMFTISSVNFSSTRGDAVEKGDEVGNFAYGGSAIILLFEPGRVSFTVPLGGPPRHVSMGNALAAAVQPVQTATTGTNLGVVTFNTTAGSIHGLTSTGINNVRCVNPDYCFPYGLFSYSLVNLRPGQHVTLTIRFPNPLPLGTKYFKCNNNMLIDCSAFTSRVNEYLLSLEIVDGGQGDGDGLVNGTITDSGGPGFPLKTTSFDTSGSSASIPSIPQPFIPLPDIVVESAVLSRVKASPGQPVTVTAAIANHGNASGSAGIRLFINGYREAEQNITLSGGNTKSITFILKRDRPGTYEVRVESSPAGSIVIEDDAADDIILAGSIFCIVLALVLGIIYHRQRKAASRPL